METPEKKKTKKKKLYKKTKVTEPIEMETSEEL